MVDESYESGEIDATEIKETDIVFDCPHCGKSLAIDYRGAGLTIPCSDCGKSVTVPIPEGMQISDLDSSEEEQEGRILNMRRSLTAAEYRIASLETEVEELVARRELLERGRAEYMERMSRLRKQLAVIQGAVSEIATILEGSVKTQIVDAPKAVPAAE